MRRQLKKILVFFLLLFMGISNVLAVPAHMIGFVQSTGSDMDLLEDTAASGDLIKEGYFTYHFNQDSAVLTLAHDARMALLNINKYVDDTYGFLLSKNREIEVNLNGDNVIDSLESSLDANMLLVVKGEGSLTIKTVLEHAPNENPYSVVAIQCKRYNEELKEYKEELYFFRDESGNFASFSNMEEIEEAWNELKKDSSLLLADTFNEENILLLPSLNVSSVGVTKEWVEKHIKTNYMIDYNNDGSITIRKPVEVESLTLSDSELKLDVNDIKKLTVTLNPTHADDKELIWTSSNDKVITVDQNGNLKAIRNGEAVVTVRSANEKTATCKVQVGDILKGDLNKNGKIDLTDILLLIKLYFGKIEMTDYYNIAGDMNYSDKIDLTDVLLLIKSFFGK